MLWLQSGGKKKRIKKVLPFMPFMLWIKNGKNKGTYKEEACNVGIFVQIFLPPFLSHFLPNLGRLCFGGLKEKTPAPHQNLAPFPP